MSANDPVTLRQLAEGLQAVAETDARLVISEDAQRQATEDKRSQRRNRNRVMMILVAWIASMTVPLIAHAIHQPMLGQYAAGIGFTGDLAVTGWAWWRKY